MALLEEQRLFLAPDVRILHQDHHVHVLVNILVQVALALLLLLARILDRFELLAVQVSVEVAFPLEVRLEEEVDISVQERLFGVHLLFGDGEAVGRLA